MDETGHFAGGNEMKGAALRFDPVLSQKAGEAAILGAHLQ